MTTVLSDLDLKYIDGTTWQLIADFRVVSDIAGLLEVGAGECTDFNSVPPGLREILPPDEYGEAATLHDHLYRTGQVRGQAIPRQIADAVHREFLIYRHAPAWKVRAMYAGLRLFGWVVWRRYRAADAAAVT